MRPGSRRRRSGPRGTMRSSARRNGGMRCRRGWSQAAAVGEDPGRRKRPMEAEARGRAEATEVAGRAGGRRAGVRPRHPGGAAAGATAGAKAQRNFTDPESRIMKTTTGGSRDYNAQAALTPRRRSSWRRTLTNKARIDRSLLGLVDAVEANCGPIPTQASADNGYYSDQNVTGCGAAGDRPVPGDGPAAARQRQREGSGRQAGRARSRRRCCEADRWRMGQSVPPAEAVGGAGLRANQGGPGGSGSSCSGAKPR